MYAAAPLLAAFVLPVAAALVLLLSEALTAPAHAERRNRSRSVSSRLDRMESWAGCLVGMGVLAMLGAALAYLWEHRPPW